MGRVRERLRSPSASRQVLLISQNLAFDFVSLQFSLREKGILKDDENAQRSAKNRGEGCVHHLRRELRRQRCRRVLFGRHPPRSRMQRHQRKVPWAEIQNCLCSLGEKLEAAQAETLVKLLGITEDEDGNVEYMGFIDKLLAACS